MLDNRHFTMGVVGNLHFTRAVVEDHHFSLELLDNHHFTRAVVEDHHFSLEVLDNLHFTRAVVEDHYFSLELLDNHHFSIEVLVPPPQPQFRPFMRLTSLGPAPYPEYGIRESREIRDLILTHRTLDSIAAANNNYCG